ncbi:MAG: TlpA family protein disulfide reductase [Candidatus Binataceae bacterium]
MLCFVKEDCPTCGLSMPLIEQAHQAFGSALDIVAVGQEREGNRMLAERHYLTVPVLDDSALTVSFSRDIEIVPTIILADADGGETRRFIGFDKSDWQALFAELAHLSQLPSPAVDWSAYPTSRPGCGSRSVEPGIVERLQAEADGSPIRARRIEIAPADDPFEFMFEQGLTDGLPVIPPTPERVIRMLNGTRRDPREVVGTCAPNYAPVPIEKIAINAVMAGCKPEYLPVVIAAVEIICTPEFNIHGVTATTYGATPIIVVNGPIRHRIGMNMGINVFGQGNRANATIGRAVKLIVRNVGGGRPGEVERAAFGSASKYTCCFAEFEEKSPWEPLHVERGFEPGDSVVTCFGLEGGPHQIADQTSRTARALVGSIGLGVESSWHPKTHNFGDILLVISPEHVDTIWHDRWSKEDIRRRIQEITARPLRELLPTEDYGGLGATADPNKERKRSEDELNKKIPKFQSTKNIHIAVAGGPAGKWSAMFGGWASGSWGSIPTSRKIEEVP